MMPISPVSNKSRRGLTVFEMVLVVAAILAIVAVSVPLVLRVWPIVQLSLATRQMTEDLHQAHNTALGGKQDVIVTFYPSQGLYSIDGLTHKLSVSFEVTLAGAAKQASATDAPVVTFHADGSATGATVSIFDVQRQRNIAIDPNSGQATEIEE